MYIDQRLRTHLYFFYSPIELDHSYFVTINSSYQDATQLKVK